jgi:hypothetical protein
MKKWGGRELHEPPANDERQGAVAEISNVATEMLNCEATYHQDGRNQEREKEQRHEVIHGHLSVENKAIRESALTDRAGPSTKTSMHVKRE